MNQQPQLPQIPPCPQCGGQRVGGKINTLDSRTRFEDMKEHTAASLRVFVCTACGYAAWYANTEELAQAIQKHPGDFLY